MTYGFVSLRKLACTLFAAGLITSLTACSRDRHPRKPPGVAGEGGVDAGETAGSGGLAGAAGAAGAAGCDAGRFRRGCVPPGAAGRGGDGGAGSVSDGGLAGAGGEPVPPRTYLTRRGSELYYGDKPYKSVGINAFGMAGCETGSAYSEAVMSEYFASLRPNGLTRAWAFQAQGISGVTRMVRAAEAHSQLLILSLADGRGYCNETDGRIGGEGSGKQASWYESGYKSRYLPWLETVVTRFKDSPAIAFWELVNEPGGDEVSDETMRKFFDDAAARIKAIDKNHLVMSGSQAQYVDGTRDYAYVHAGPDIDAASLHEYDYDDSDGRIVSSHLSPALRAMKSLDKPLLIAEVGIRAGTSRSCTDFETRRDAFKQKFDAYLPQSGVAAVIVWSWVPRQRSGCVYEATSSDPLMSLLRAYP